MPQDQDIRARLRPRVGQEDYVYGVVSEPSDPRVGRNNVNPLEPLKITNGLIWPFTPNITFQREINYQPVEMTHTIQNYQYYSGARSPRITVGGEFTAQNMWEAAYLFAVIHFLRVVGLQEFGDIVRTERDNIEPGLPPPILLFSAYGNFMFNDIPVIVETFNIQLPNNVDYVPVYFGGDRDAVRIEGRASRGDNEVGQAWVPAQISIDVTLAKQRPPQDYRREFDLTDFKNGSLLGGRKGWT